ncbi:MAG: carboxypeptidase regulatory-like domain-containing protein [Acidobacteriaceae bacterium]|jgi:hypothetical protein
MRQTHLIHSLLIALTLSPVTLSAQLATAAPKSAAAAVAVAAAHRSLPPHSESPADLPVTRVALYKNGVGFFEHSGRVTGDQSVNVDFTTSQLDDVLQSLTAIDLNGGRIAGADYNSATPLEQQLKALPLALGQDPTAVDFYNAIRGARVEVRSGSSTVTGRLLNIEVVNLPATANQPASERRQMTVVGDAGDVHTVELTPATEVHLLDADLHQDVTRYLQLLANTRNQGLRHLTLQDNGTGARELRVSYISEVPIWKSTYRILFTEPNPSAANTTTTAPTPTATLQGWSVVDNTTGADWINVRLSLIAGAPQSFIQPLSQPIYSRRPQIGIAQQAQLAPQLHQSGESYVGRGRAGIQGRVTDKTGAAVPNAQVIATNTDTGAQRTVQTNSTGSYSVVPLAPGNYNLEVVARGFQRLLQENVTIDATSVQRYDPRLSVGGQNTTITVTEAPPFISTDATLGGAIESELYSQQPLSINGAARSPMGFQYLMPGAGAGANNGNSGIYAGAGQTNLNKNFITGAPAAAPAPVNYEEAARDSLASSSTTAAFDDYFAYNISEPITIHKNESALVPILQTKIDAERVTLWSRQQPVPLRALWVTNTSSLTLDRGSFSIVEDGNFGGQGLLEPIHPDEKRLLSYAVDQAVRVTTDQPTTFTRFTSISAAKGVVVLHNTQIADTTYLVRNAAGEPRTVVVEHPIRAGFTLASTGIDGAPAATPAETTPAVYRFRVAVRPNQTARLHVTETQPGETSYQLTDSTDEQLQYIVNQTGHNAAFEAALQPILDARRHVADMQEAADTASGKLNALQSDEQRQRDNVAALANAERTSRERFVHDLNATEDRIATAQKDLTAAQANLQAAQDDLASRIESFQISQTIEQPVAPPAGPPAAPQAQLNF